MNLHDLQTMIDYHYWARDRLLDALESLTPEQYNRDLGSSFKSIRETVTHTYAAEWAWFMRWRGESPAALLPADRFSDLADAAACRQPCELSSRPGHHHASTDRRLAGQTDGHDCVLQSEAISGQSVGTQRTQG